MPRPRKDDPHAAATARIESAFWMLLEEVGYPEITVRRVSQAAGANRNSFYYHYEGLEDLARKAFLANATGAYPLISSLVAGFREGGAQSVRLDEGVVEHARRVMLCARSESPFLRGMVGELLRDVWFGELGIDGSTLSADDRVQVVFIFAVLGSAEAAESPLVMTQLAASPMGRAAMAALREMAERQSIGTS